MDRIRTLLLILVIAALLGCGARAAKPGDLPRANQGVAFFRVILDGRKETYIHVFNEHDRIGPHAARVDAIQGDDVYAFFLPGGTYDIGQISSGQLIDIWPAESRCPSFSVTPGTTTFAGTVYIAFAGAPAYVVRCATEDMVALDMFTQKYPELQAQSANK